MRVIFKGFVIAVGGVLVVLGLGLVFGASQWDVWARQGLERQLSAILDVPVTVGKVVTHPTTRTVEILDVVVGNPRSFDVGPAIEAPHIAVQINPASVFASKLEFPTIRVEGARLHLHYSVGVGTNLSVLTARAHAWRDSAHFGWRPPGYRIGELTSAGAELTTHALGKSVTTPLADMKLTNVESEAVESMGGVAAGVLQRMVDGLLSAETVLEGLRERLGDEFRSWMGETPM